MIKNEVRHTGVRHTDIARLVLTRRRWRARVGGSLPKVGFPASIINVQMPAEYHRIICHFDDNVDVDTV